MCKYMHMWGEYERKREKERAHRVGKGLLKKHRPLQKGRELDE